LFSIIEKNDFFQIVLKFIVYETKGKKIDDYSSNKDHAFILCTDEAYFLTFFVYLTNVTADYRPLNISLCIHTESKKKHNWIKNNNDYLKRDKIDRMCENSSVPLT